MIKRLFGSLLLSLMTLVSLVSNSNAQENFILPKSFKINDKYLPPLEQNSSTPQKSTTVKTNDIPNAEKSKVIIKKTPNLSTVQTNPVVRQTPVNAYVQPTKTEILVNPPTVIKNQINTAINPASLVSSLKNFSSPYDDTLKSTLLSLSDAGAMLTTYDTQTGEILANLPGGKEIFVLVQPNGTKSTYVRITPTDGNYNIPSGIISQIFKEINFNLP